MSVRSQEEPINIRDLAINEPPKKNELLFDPQVEITNQDLQGVVRLFEAFRDGANVPNSLLEIAASVKIARPDFLDRLEFNQKSFDQIDRSLKGAEVSLWKLFSSSAVFTKILFPNRFKSLKVDDVFGEMTQKLTERKSIIKSSALVFTTDVSDYYDFASHLAILFPGKFSLQPRDKEWDEINESLASLNEKERLLFFARVARSRRILFPERDTRLPHHTWLELKNLIKELQKKPSRRVLIELARDLTILAADEVKITEEGIELISNPQPFPVTQPLPERRKF